MLKYFCLLVFCFAEPPDEITPPVGGNGVRSVWEKYYAEVCISLVLFFSSFNV